MDRVQLSTSALEQRPCPGCGAQAAPGRCDHCGVALAPGGLRVVRVLAQSAHGRVYEAEDEAGRRVALKELAFALVPTLQHLEAFEREARLLAQLSHPRIPRFVKSFTEGTGVHTRMYLAQEFIRGQSLAAALEHQRFEESEALAIAESVLEILQHLHGLSPRVLHRDLKPANLIRDPDGHVFLVDFGVARELAGAQTHNATLVGTFGYMPPEQLGGTVDARSDLYALGATLVHLLTGKPPEAFYTPELQLDPGAQLGTSGFAERFIGRLVAHRPQGRFASAAQALAYLRSRGRAGRTRRLLPWVVAAAVALGVGGAVWWRIQAALTDGDVTQVPDNPTTLPHRPLPLPPTSPLP